MWVLNNYVISLGIYLVLRVVSGGNVSLTGPCRPRPRRRGSAPSMRRSGKAKGCFGRRSRRRAHSQKSISLSDTGFETLILAASPGSRSNSMTANSDGLRAGHRRHAQRHPAHQCCVGQLAPVRTTESDRRHDMTDDAVRDETRQPEAAPGAGAGLDHRGAG